MAKATKGRPTPRERGYETHEHSYTGGGKRGDFAHSHEGGSEPHLHPDTGPSHFTGRWPQDRRKFTAKPTGPQLEYVARPPEASTFRVVFVDEYTPGHAAAGINRERWERERAAFIDQMEGGGNYLSMGADRRMADSFGLTPVYILDKPEEGAMNDTRICPWCEAVVGAREYCPTCTEAMGHLPDPTTMTVAQRQAEFDRYDAPLTVPWHLLHRRVEALIGRPVLTHEFASSVWPQLREELASGDHPGPAAIMAKALQINPNLTVVGVVIDDEGR